jgi:NADPH:quinone reductase-like Zn-dependent oxidoreductase
MLRSIGADHVIDYTREDFTKNGEVDDIIFDVVGTISFSRSRASIRKQGTYLLANPATQLARAYWARMTNSRKIIMQAASPSIEDLIFLRKLVEEGILKAVIDRTYALGQIAEAHHYVEQGGKLGNVVISVE